MEKSFVRTIPYNGLSEEETLKLSSKWLDNCADPTNYGLKSPVIKTGPDEVAHIDKMLVPLNATYFKPLDRAIFVDFEKKIKTHDPNINKDFGFFVLSSKRCYSKLPMLKHFTNYLNYFEFFYDTEYELMSIYYNMKYFIDYIPDYSEENFIQDIKRYIIFNRNILSKVYMLNEDNYCINLKRKKGKSISNLQYDTKHGKILMQMSLLMVLTIPLISHFIFIKKSSNNELISKVFDIIINMSSCNIYSKFYETASYEINKNRKIHSELWNKQSIRGNDTLIQTLNSISNIILNVMPKYHYIDNIISLNSVAIKNSIKYGVTDIAFEYNFNSLSSSLRDEDSNSEFDKYEAYQIRQDENISIQNKVNCRNTMEYLERNFRPISQEEIEFYKERLSEDDSNIIVKFQKERIFNLFAKYFGDTVSINEINIDGYVKLLIMAKEQLLNYKLCAIPYIISGKINRLANRKNINNKERIEIEASPTWQQIDYKYGYNPYIKEKILGEIATIISSSFTFIDFFDKELDGKPINIKSTAIIREEYLQYILLI